MPSVLVLTSVILTQVPLWTSPNNLLYTGNKNQASSQVAFGHVFVLTEIEMLTKTITARMPSGLSQEMEIVRRE